MSPTDWSGLDPGTFRDPGTEYRPGPFWVWNDRMDDNTIDDQVDLLGESGWGAFFPHARFGLTVDCLSEEWFRKVARSVERGIEAGMEPWLYDEDHWPSGYAGGAIPALGGEYRVKCLALKDELTLDDDPLDTVVHDGKRYHLVVTTPGRDADMTARGTPYADLLNPDVVEEFLARSYERYEEVLGEHFGEGIPGIFTDEPQLFVKPESPNLHGFVPWTVGMPTLFTDEYGYDLLEHAPSLFFDREVDGRSYEAVRYDFWRLVTERFVGTYSERLGEWCRERDLMLTGHYQHEHSIHEQIRTSGAVMPHYAHQGRPGIDHLGRNVINRQNNPLKAKQCSSVARQFGREALCELYGCSGQQLTFEDRKWLADWQLVHGITFVNHHLSLYSMRGERKRDYPPNLFYQQPWWEYNDRVADYVSRVAYALRQGSAGAETLVLHPIQTGWLRYSNADERDLSTLTEHQTMANETVQALDERFNDLVEELLAAHVGFDLGDELILADTGGIEDDRFVVGDADYGTVVVPYCDTLQESTVDLIEEFADAGGDVLVVGDPPMMVEGRPAEDRLEGLRAAAEAADVGGVIDRARRHVRLLDGQGEETATDVRVHIRETDGGLLAFLVNPDREEAREFTIQFDRVGRVERWDPTSGEREALAAVRRGDATTVEATLAPTGSLLLELTDSRAPDSEGATVAPPAMEGGAELILNGEWTVERSEPNQLVIDRCELTLNGEELGETNVAARWQDKTALDDPAGHVSFEATYEFDVTDRAPDSGYALVVESADEQEVSFNGTELEETDDRWRDVHWHRFDIDEHVHCGTNTVTLSGTRSETVGIEAIYVLGAFGVDPESHDLVAEPETVDPGDLTEQGYPFYTGEFTLETAVDCEASTKGMVTFDDVHATLMSVSVGDSEDGERCWRPWRIPVSLAAGTNRLRVTLVTSLRNLTGPLHTSDPTPTFVTPESFRPDEENAYLERNDFTEEYVTVPVGVEGPRLILSDADPAAGTDR